MAHIGLTVVITTPNRRKLMVTSITRVNHSMYNVYKHNSPIDTGSVVLNVYVAAELFTVGFRQ